MCYHAIEELLTWFDAREECRLRGGFGEGGDLASINSVLEDIFIQSELIDLIVKWLYLKVLASTINIVSQINLARSHLFLDFANVPQSSFLKVLSCPQKDRKW